MTVSLLFLKKFKSIKKYICANLQLKKPTEKTSKRYLM
ncbi:hypothetical protein PHEL49_2443 [Polaribacter sp. Hel1_33_49]|nr:hypothetical protein PHEL49_2443 [Polaribacter sp. Hel1_33_49]